MKKHIATTLLLLMIMPCLTMAQKKELSQARTYIKSRKDYDKAEKLMTDLLKDSANRANEKIYVTWYDAVRGQYDAANEKLYLKQKQDTAAFFLLVRRMFTILETLDSLDMKPDAKGRVVLDYRQKNANLLNAQRTNLYGGGTYFIKKSNWKNAFDFMETYIDCARQPLFTGLDYEHTDKRMAQAAYWAMFAAYKMHDPVLTLRHRNLALQDESKAQYTLHYVAEARHWLNDDELYLAALEEGMRRFPKYHYFFPRLMDFYTDRGQYKEALATVDMALQADSTSELFLFAKSTVLLSLERYEESIAYSDRVIAINEDKPEPYFNAGSAYLNMALILDDQGNKQKTRELYEKARPYMEQYRKLQPDAKDKWAPALYRIYLNLNMGKQFDEIDRIMKK